MKLVIIESPFLGDVPRNIEYARKCMADCIKRGEAPFAEIDAFSHLSSLSATNNKKKTIERLFWNGRGNINQCKLF